MNQPIELTPPFPAWDSARCRDVFVSSTGQDDNLGDSVLRREFLEAMRNFGRLKVLIGANSEDYVQNLGIRDEQTFTSPAKWRAAAMQSALRGGSIFAFNCGEMRLDRSYLRTYWGHAPLIVATRARGGDVFHLGYGIRPTLGLSRLPVLAPLRLSNEVTWRDAASRSTAGFGRVVPDWAFYLFTQDQNVSRSVPRGRIAISLRGDRGAPSQAWLTSVRELASAEQLEPVIVAQVRRDSALARDVGRALGAEAISWDSSSHVQQETVVRNVYRECRYVITDRLHAAIIGLSEGALPIPFAPEGGMKVLRTLVSAGIPLDQIDATASSAELIQYVKRLDTRAEEIFGSAGQAGTDIRADLLDISQRLRVRP